MVSSQITDADLVRVAQELPVGPRLLVELGQAIRNPDVDSREITALLRQDSAMVARIIRMANSAAYARAEPAASIEEALASVGFEEVHRMVGAVANSRLTDEPMRLYGLDGAQLRKNGLFIGLIMEELAKISGEEPRACYTVGLLRSVGKFALERLAKLDDSVLPFGVSDEIDVDVWEKKSWGVTNCQVAERLLQHWRLPIEIVTAIRDHYHPEQRDNPVTHLLNLAAGSAEHQSFGLPGEENFWMFAPENFTKAGIDARQFAVASEKAQRTFIRLHSALG